MTLSTTIPSAGQSPAIIVPGKPDALSISFQQLNSHVLSFQRDLAQLGIAPQAAVSIALPNSYEFIVAFLAASWQRAIAAPLNPAYKQEEFEFYIGDLDSAVALIPLGSFRRNGPVVRAARKYKAAVAECYWNGRKVILDIKDSGKLHGKQGQGIQKAQADDVALVLHTSGTTGKPKAVCPELHSQHSQSVVLTSVSGTVNSSESYKDNGCVIDAFDNLFLDRTEQCRKRQKHVQIDL